MTRTLARLALTTTIALAGAVTGAPASAQVDPVGPALARIAEGTYTPSDLALLRRHPRLAAQVPDPTQQGRAHVVAGQTVTTGKVAGTCGYWVDVWFRKRSLLGHTMYK